MLPDRRLRVLQFCIAILWLSFFALGIQLFFASGIPLKHFPRTIKGIVSSYGMWGPLCILGLYIFRSVFFFVPSTILTLVSGSLYGPFFGTVLNILGENLTAHLSFGIARLFGRRFVRAHEHGWVKKYDDLLRQEGFLTIFFMRALYFPFDLVNYGSGMTGMLYRQYAMGTFIGLLPQLITLTVLGGTLTHPKAFVISLILWATTILGALCLRRSHWVKQRLYPSHVHDTI